MNFAEYLHEKRRLDLLRLLREADGSCNESNLHYGAIALGHKRVTRDDIRADLEWLRVRGLVTHDWFNDKVLVAELTERGENVAAGREHCEGVEKPSRIG